MLQICVDGVIRDMTPEEEAAHFAPPPPRDPDEARAAALSLIDAQAEAARLSFITAGDGQALVYQAKKEECARWQAAGGPDDPAGFPFLSAEMARTGLSAAEVMGVWADAQGRWIEIAAAIETIRLAAKDQIRAAPDAAAVDAVVAGVAWPGAAPA